MSLSQRISAASARHSALLTELAALDHVPASLAQATKYFEDVQQTARVAEGRLHAAQQSKQKEWEEHHSMEDSNVRKFAAKLVGMKGKWEKKASKEEKEYLDAVENELKEKQALEGVQATLNQAWQNVGNLRSALARREALQRELLGIYQSVFDGPSPEAPQDDRLEQAFHHAEAENNRMQSTFSHESQTLTILNNAHSALSNLVQKMVEAQGHSTMDVYGVGGNAADMMETHAITQAQMLKQQLDTLMDQARRFNNAVSALPEIRIPHHSMTDIYFDNVFSDMMQHDKISAGTESARYALNALGNEIGRARYRVDAASQQVNFAAGELNRARAALQDFRRQTFENIARNQSSE
ncbi:hypothetical protein AURDEDRAFT_173952 [Auricularia subglabra TFB-10046 SS5]|uniref:Uncharacterized protein n=1 Tax=Auricularia subglabra (strain TFB-10046 / SS5) TaxID=717982 RepID=J0CZH0_AURST|nr:hypothetical protein AURDEDRAFT_173952 [Auricularia subglabra TFB-10046 SS5]